jgi:tRNA pseudouridine13 synthase
MYRIKQLPEDFIVREVADHETSPAGSHSLYIMKKTGWNTQSAVELIARRFYLKPKLIGYAGAKDRNAITYQYISVPGPQRDFMHKDIGLDFQGMLTGPICLGDLKGNRFDITVRNILSEPQPIESFPNMFGEQRFGSSNAEIGKLIILKDFKGAVEQIVKDSPYRDQMQFHLQKQMNDYIGALKIIPIRLLRLYIHAYQSLLWNQAREKLEDVPAIPLIGFGTDLLDDKTGKVIKAILSEEGIRLDDFIIRPFPDLSTEGDMRNSTVKIKDLDIGFLEEDELNAGRYKTKVRFYLPKGSYATVALSYLFG